jgi:hypothetical protein
MYMDSVVCDCRARRLLFPNTRFVWYGSIGICTTAGRCLVKFGILGDGHAVDGLDSVLGVHDPDSEPFCWCSLSLSTFFGRSDIHLGKSLVLLGPKAGSPIGSRFEM